MIYIYIYSITVYIIIVCQKSSSPKISRPRKLPKEPAPDSAATRVVKANKKMREAIAWIEDEGVAPFGRPGPYGWLGVTG